MISVLKLVQKNQKIFKKFLNLWLNKLILKQKLEKNKFIDLLNKNLIV